MLLNVDMDVSDLCTDTCFNDGQRPPSAFVLSLFPILKHVFHYLSAFEISQVRQVNRTWNHVGSVALDGRPWVYGFVHQKGEQMQSKHEEKKVLAAKVKMIFLNLWCQPEIVLVFCTKIPVNQVRMPIGCMVAGGQVDCAIGPESELGLPGCAYICYPKLDGLVVQTFFCPDEEIKKLKTARNLFSLNQGSDALILLFVKSSCDMSPVVKAVHKVIIDFSVIFCSCYCYCHLIAGFAPFLVTAFADRIQPFPIYVFWEVVEVYASLVLLAIPFKRLLGPTIIKRFSVASKLGAHLSGLKGTLPSNSKTNLRNLVRRDVEEYFCALSLA